MIQPMGIKATRIARPSPAFAMARAPAPVVITKAKRIRRNVREIFQNRGRGPIIPIATDIDATPAHHGQADEIAKELGTTRAEMFERSPGGYLLKRGKLPALRCEYWKRVQCSPAFLDLSDAAIGRMDGVSHTTIVTALKESVHARQRDMGTGHPPADPPQDSSGKGPRAGRDGQPVLVVQDSHAAG
jgi:hypothetical protein